MNNKKLIQALGFLPKENTSGIFQKKYSEANNYAIEIDFEKGIINFGNKVIGESKTTQNFLQAENWVVLECIDRLLEKGYQPQNITLEKTWKTGHGTSGRLDILVSKDDGSAYLMIECKNWGTEYEKEFKNLEKNGGQLFTYFQQDKNAEVLMLYTSKLEGKTIEYKNTIVKIEEDYRQTGNVKDFYERWNKLPKTNGIFENWVEPYEFQSKALTRNDLKVLKQEDSSFIFNRFLEILRHNVVSDKPNAFNKIFTLFLCKIVDENRNPDEQLHFQWLEGEDDHISFQKRLTDLYNRGMLELLEKKVTDVSDTEFDKQFQQVEDQYKDKFKEILTEIRLKKNNEFAIKEVYDDTSFEENAKVVKEVVELLQVYQIRYNYRQQFLSDFFELLLTTGLKQESGQFFTPVPIARFIIKSLPIQEIASEKIEQGNKNDLLPTIIDYSAGSGHFITESMEIVQEYIDQLDENQYTPTTKRAIKKWKEDQFDWAEDYVYAIEKDYRLVKTAKVSCYLHGDGLAKVIHGDGLGDFATSNDFKDLLKINDKTYPQDNKQFDIVISNPPYSVSAFKGTMMEEEKAKQAFDLYNRLTDQSSEIECLFIERTKQLLKDGGVAGIILPSSMLNNTGIYTQTREIILKYFDILGITELGSGTFMATGTNTVTLFLRRRNNADAFNIEESVKKFFTNLKDVTINGIEKPVQKYVAHVWEDLSFEDYLTLLGKKPNETVKKHEIYKEYDKKIKAKDEAEKWNNILALEQEKLLYFIITYPQKIVLVKTGEKNEEKRFLGYEFSNRRGSEGIHPVQRGKTIDECTQLFDVESFDNTEKASTYIYKAFQGEFDLDISESLQQNVSYQNLVDMLTFNQVTFEKSISLSVKKKVKIESKWDVIKIENIAKIKNGFAFKSVEYVDAGLRVVRIKNVKNGYLSDDNPVYIAENREKEFADYLLEENDILVSMTGNPGRVTKISKDSLPALLNQRVGKFEIISTQITKEYFYHIINTQFFESSVVELAKGLAQLNISASTIESIPIPLPPKDIQEKIVKEIEVLEEKGNEAQYNLNDLNLEIQSLINSCFSKFQLELLGNACYSVEYGSSAKSEKKGLVPVIRMGNIQNGRILLDDLVYTNNQEEIEKYSLKYNDVLFNRTNSPELVGKTGIYQSKEPAIFAGYLIRINYKEDIILPVYLNYVLNSETIRNYGFSVMSKSVNQANINGTILKSYKIPLPPIYEQQKIVTQIEYLENKIAKLEKEIAEIPKQKEVILWKYLN
ncbi:restriction endonuclease subunit S [Elizabethkingia anophelis]|nr:restriction endonuclease subunit S [Elizabethkingia anophelis]